MSEIEEIFLGHPAGAWGLALIVALLAWVVFGFLHTVLKRRLEWLSAKTSNAVDDSIADALNATRLWLWIAPALYLGSLTTTTLPARAIPILSGAATVSLMVQGGLWGMRLIEFWVSQSRRQASPEDVATAGSLAAMRFIGKLLLWSLLLLLALDNLGVDITALVAGLGIGGIAVALAVQNILGDLFASLSIVVDKPFEIGDFITVDEYAGSVEAIGLKTTRIRSLGGEQIVFSNSDLLGSRVRNYKRMYERRVLFRFGVTYQTRPEQLEEIPALARSCIEGLEAVRFDRAHFATLGDSAYEFEVVYWVLSPQYAVYMDCQQTINLALVRGLAARGIGFAYPTRTLFLGGDPAAAPVLVASPPDAANSGDTDPDTDQRADANTTSPAPTPKREPASSSNEPSQPSPQER